MRAEHIGAAAGDDTVKSKVVRKVGQVQPARRHKANAAVGPADCLDRVDSPVLLRRKELHRAKSQPDRRFKLARRRNAGNDVDLLRLAVADDLCIEARCNDKLRARCNRFLRLHHRDNSTRADEYVRMIFSCLMNVCVRAFHSERDLHGGNSARGQRLRQRVQIFC
ncbi:hypothetical protein SDC9_123212 [bioreactor metagenome]|uniref:Uncharacterized protein n=1 Tax=bioreactor metagenome TaxID=1076179 RepID=A0A645CGZ3_9ZZZZ